MRVLLATTCLTPIALFAAVPAAAQTVTVSDTRTGETRTSIVDAGQPADLSITSGGVLSNSSDDTNTGGVALAVDSANSVTNNGTITVSGNGQNSAVNLVVARPNSARNFVNNGTISVTEAYQPVDLDNDGDLDGPLAKATFRNGIRVGTTSDVTHYVGDIVNSASGHINVNGVASTGIYLGDVVSGNVINDGMIKVVGEFSSGILTGSRLEGDLIVGGTVDATGESSSAVVVNGVVLGKVVISGTLSATGLRFPTPPADRSRLDPDDLMPSGPALSVASYVDKGIATTAGSEIRLLGNGTAIDIGASEGNITIGASADGFSLSVGGKVSADGIYNGLDTYGIGVRQAVLTGGIGVSGNVAATAVDAKATGIDLGFDASLPQVVVTGTLTARSRGTSGSAIGIAIADGADVTRIGNAGTIAVSASGGASATAILASSESLKTIDNTGTISAIGGTGPGSSRAIDLTATTGGITINQATSGAGAPAPLIGGDIALGSGNDVVNIGSGTVIGTIDLTTGGSDRVALSQNAVLTGNVSGGTTGMVGLGLADTASMTGNAQLGDGSVTLAGSARFRGNVSFSGSGISRVDLASAADLKGNVTFAGKGALITVNNGSTLTGDVSFGGDQSRIDVGQTAAVVGNIMFVGEAGVVTLSDASKLIGNVTFGSGTNASMNVKGASVLTGDVDFVSAGVGNRMSVTGSSKVTGNVTFGTGGGEVVLDDASVMTGTLNFNGGTSVLTLGGTSRMSGNLAGTQNAVLNVAGGTLDLLGTPVVALRALNVSAGGTLVVNIDAATLMATRFNVATNASFATGSKLLLHVDGLLDRSAHIVIVHAGSVTGGENVTANDVVVPILFRSTLTHSATEIALDLVRKSGDDLGLNRSGSTAIDPIIIAAGSDPKVGEAIGNIGDTGGLKGVVASILPDHAGGIFEAVTGGSRALDRRLSDGGAAYVERDHTAFWIDTLYWSGNKDTGNTAGYRVSGWGYAGGGEAKTTLGNFGLSGAYLRGSVLNTDTRANRVTTDQVEASLYWHGQWDGLRSFARLSQSWIGASSQRRFDGAIGTERIARLSSGKWGADLFSAAGGATYETRLGALSIRPIASLEYYRLDEKAHTDRGGGPALDLAVARRQSDEFAGNATLSLGTNFGSVGNGWFRAEVEGGWRQILAGRMGDTTARFMAGQAFTLLADQRTDGWVGRFRLSGGKGKIRIGGEFSAEQQQQHTSLAVRGTIRVDL